MITNEEARKAIEKYQKEHPLHFGTMIDVTAISSKEGADIISRTVEEISKKIEEDTELWCICEMAKMYMQGVRPVYPVKHKGEWIVDDWSKIIECNKCRGQAPIDITSGEQYRSNFCPICGADMRKGGAK